MSGGRGAYGLTFDVLAIIQAFLVLFAGSFLAASMTSSDSMVPAVYGKATAYPSTWWASWFLLGHGCGAAGMWLGRLRLAGAGVALVTPAYFLLAVLAQPAAYGSIITLHSVLVGAPLNLLTLAVIVLFGGRNER